MLACSRASAPAGGGGPEAPRVPAAASLRAESMGERKRHTTFAAASLHRRPAHSTTVMRIRNAAVRPDILLRFLLLEIIVVFEEDVLMRVEIFQNDARAARNRREGVVCYQDRHFEPLHQKLVEASQKRASAHQHDAVADDVGEDLGRSRIEHFADRLDERIYRLRYCFADVLVGKRDLARKARDEVAAADDCFDVAAALDDGADGDFCRLRSLFPDEHFKLGAHMGDDVAVELVACAAQVLGAHDAAERYDRNVDGAASDIDYHAAYRLPDRHADAERRGHGLFNYIYFAGTRIARRVFDRAYLDVGDAGGHADNSPRAQQLL